MISLFLLCIFPIIHASNYTLGVCGDDTCGYQSNGGVPQILNVSCMNESLHYNFFTDINCSTGAVGSIDTGLACSDCDQIVRVTSFQFADSSCSTAPIATMVDFPFPDPNGNLCAAKNLVLGQCTPDNNGTSLFFADIKGCPQSVTTPGLCDESCGVSQSAQGEFFANTACINDQVFFNAYANNASCGMSPFASNPLGIGCDDCDQITRVSFYEFGNANCDWANVTGRYKNFPRYDPSGFLCENRDFIVSECLDNGNGTSMVFDVIEGCPEPELCDTSCGMQTDGNFTFYANTMCVNNSAHFVLYVDDECKFPVQYGPTGLSCEECDTIPRITVYSYEDSDCNGTIIAKTENFPFGDFSFPICQFKDFFLGSCDEDGNGTYSYFADITGCPEPEYCDTSCGSRKSPQETIYLNTDCVRDTVVMQAFFDDTCGGSPLMMQPLGLSCDECENIPRVTAYEYDNPYCNGSAVAEMDNFPGIGFGADVCLLKGFLLNQCMPDDNGTSIYFMGIDGCPEVDICDEGCGSRVSESENLNIRTECYNDSVIAGFYFDDTCSGFPAFTSNTGISCDECDSFVRATAYVFDGPSCNGSAVAEMTNFPMFDSGLQLCFFGFEGSCIENGDNTSTYYESVTGCPEPEYCDTSCGSRKSPQESFNVNVDCVAGNVTMQVFVDDTCSGPVIYEQPLGLSCDECENIPRITAYEYDNPYCNGSAVAEMDNFPGIAFGADVCLLKGFLLNQCMPDDNGTSIYFMGIDGCPEVDICDEGCGSRVSESENLNIKTECYNDSVIAGFYFDDTCSGFPAFTSDIGISCDECDSFVRATAYVFDGPSCNGSVVAEMTNFPMFDSGPQLCLFGFEGSCIENGDNTSTYYESVTGCPEPEYCDTSCGSRTSPQESFNVNVDCVAGNVTMQVFVDDTCSGPVIHEQPLGLSCDECENIPRITAYEYDNPYCNGSAVAQMDNFPAFGFGLDICEFKGFFVNQCLPDDNGTSTYFMDIDGCPEVELCDQGCGSVLTSFIPFSVETECVNNSVYVGTFFGDACLGVPLALENTELSCDECEDLVRVTAYTYDDPYCNGTVTAALVNFPLFEDASEICFANYEGSCISSANGTSVYYESVTGCPDPPPCAIESCGTLSRDGISGGVRINCNSMKELELEIYVDDGNCSSIPTFAQPLNASCSECDNVVLISGARYGTQDCSGDPKEEFYRLPVAEPAVCALPSQLYGTCVAGSIIDEVIGCELGPDCFNGCSTINEDGEVYSTLLSCNAAGLIQTAFLGDTCDPDAAVMQQIIADNCSCDEVAFLTYTAYDTADCSSKATGIYSNLPLPFPFPNWCDYAREFYPIGGCAKDDEQNGTWIIPEVLKGCGTLDPTNDPTEDPTREPTVDPTAATLDPTPSPTVSVGSGSLNTTYALTDLDEASDGYRTAPGFIIACAMVGIKMIMQLF